MRLPWTWIIRGELAGALAIAAAEGQGWIVPPAWMTWAIAVPSAIVNFGLVLYFVKRDEGAPRGDRPPVP